MANFGHNDYDSRRRTSLSDLSSSTKGEQGAVALKGGNRFKSAGRTQFDPYFRVEHIAAKVNGFGESGGVDAIALSDVKVKSTVHTFGGKPRYTFDASWGEVTPHARLEVHRQTQESTNSFAARLVAAPDATQPVDLPPGDHSYGNFALGASGIY